MNQRIIQKALILILMCTILYMLGVDLDSPYSWAIWSILALTITLEYLAYWAGINEGIEMYLKLTPEQREEIERVIRSAE